MDVSRKDGQGTRQDAMHREQPSAGRSHDGICLANACAEEDLVANRALAFFFFPILLSLVLMLQLAQQSPRDNHGQDETH